jgi:hypothetical protein
MVGADFGLQVTRGAGRGKIVGRQRDPARQLPGRARRDVEHWLETLPGATRDELDRWIDRDRQLSLFVVEDRPEFGRL